MLEFSKLQKGYMTKKDNATFDYDGSDLEAMMLAGNYYKWIAKKIKPYLGTRVVEVGAGVGSFSKHIDGLGKKELLLLEPSKKMFDLLNQNVSVFVNKNVHVENSYLSDATKKIKDFSPDTFVYINVFEHIKDDVAEMKYIANNLSSDGHVVIFVPALQSLYSNFDRSIDHYRRYTKKSIRALINDADLEVVRLQYMDMPGILPWWFSFVLMKRTKLVPLLVKTYDGLCVPIIRVLETFIQPPVGKNILLVAAKKSNN